MKRISALIITLAALASACSDSISFTPGISFITPEPEILEETAIFRIIGQPFESADSVRIPVIFGGTAEIGVDYDVSSDHFVFTGESPTDSIVISTRQLGTGRTVSLSFEVPEGFAAGKYLSSEFTLQNKYGLLSFFSSKSYIADTTEFSIVLIDSTGKARALSKDCPISFSVNKEKSTAMEGTDFNFVGPSELSIAGGSSTAAFRIAPVGDTPAPGKDKIVLNVLTDERFDLGPIPEMELDLLRRELKVLDGSWKIDSLKTDSLYFKSIWGTQCTGYSQLPQFSASDAFEVSFGTCSFSPAMFSGLKNYFVGDSYMEFGEEIEITDLEGNSKKVQLLALNKTNRYFSADTTSADSLSYVGIYLTKNELTRLDMLEMYILDHTSMSFMPELESGMKYGTEKPVATAPGMYLSATFRKRK